MNKKIDPSILVRAQKGSLGAFEQIVSFYEKMILNYLLRFFQQFQEAEDATQETFIKIYKNLSRIDPDSNFESWLYKIATNTAYDILRKKKKQNELQALLTETSLAEEIPKESVREYLEQTEDLELLQKALHGIKPAYQAVLQLYYYQNFSYKEIAYILSTNINTVKVNIFRAKQALRNQLQALKNPK